MTKKVYRHVQMDRSHGWPFVYRPTGQIGTPAIVSLTPNPGALAGEPGKEVPVEELVIDSHHETWVR